MTDADSSSSESYNSDDSDSFLSISDITKLKPYDFESEASSSDDELE